MAAATVPGLFRVAPISIRAEPVKRGLVFRHEFGGPRQAGERDTLEALAPEIMAGLAMAVAIAMDEVKREVCQGRRPIR